MGKRVHPIKVLVLVVMVLLVFGAGAVVWWLSGSYQPDKVALAALDSRDGVRYEQSGRGWYVFTPVDNPAPKGFIFYPGGKVDPRAYASLAQAIAKRGFLVVIVPMPLNLAVLDPEAGKEVVRAFPSVDVWALGGHSLGGAMAAQAVSTTSLYRGLVLMAAYANPPADLSDRRNLYCLSLTGSQDRVLSKEKYLANMKLLPPNTVHQEINGGNHGQFGSYGPQEGDGQATVSPASQESTTAKLIADFMETL